jgi:MSHA pilin protein MshA
MNGSKGFTLIELVVVIVILGILAAVAIPKFVDLSGEAGNASAQATAGAISAASEMNYAKYKANSGTCAGTTCTAVQTAVATCSTVGGLISPALTATTGTALQWVANNTLACTNSTDTTSCAVRYGTAGTAYSATITCTN